MQKIILTILSVTLAGCATDWTEMGHRDPVEIKRSLGDSIQDSQAANIPDAVMNDLMPDVNNEYDDIKMLKRFNVQAKDVDAKVFFPSLVQGTDYSIALQDGVTGSITLNMTNVTLAEVLSTVRDIYGYEIVQSGKIIQVFPAGLRTETIPINYLQFTRNGMSLTTITTGSMTTTESDSSDTDSSSSNTSSSATGGTRIETNYSSDFWAQLQTAVAAMIGTEDGRSVTVSPQAGLLTVKAYPNEIREIKDFLAQSEKSLQRQVILEAKIMEVTLSDGYQQGIDWSNLTATANNEFAGGGTFSNTVNTNSTSGEIFAGLNEIASVLGGGAGMIFTDGNFQVAMAFMETQGDLNVLSSPRVTALNNQKAVIKVGDDQYFVTSVDGEVVGSGDDAVVSQDVGLTAFFSGISLDVTPQINDDGSVMLHIHPAVIDVQTDNRVIELGDDVLNLPLAKSSIRESDTVVRARDGDVIVIGGLMSSSSYDKTTKVPILGDIPVVGNLFRNTDQMTKKTELVILLKPTIVGVNTWSEELEKSQNLIQEWFPEEQ